MQERPKLVVVRLPIYTNNVAHAPPAIDVQQCIEYGKPLMYSVADYFNLYASELKPANEFVYKVNPYFDRAAAKYADTYHKKVLAAPDASTYRTEVESVNYQSQNSATTDQHAESCTAPAELGNRTFDTEVEEQSHCPEEENDVEVEVYGQVDKMIDFLSPAPVVLPHDVPWFYAGQVNLNMFNLQYNRLSQQSEAATVDSALRAALIYFFQVRPIVTANLLYILFTSMKFARVYINGVRLVQCTGNQLKTALSQCACVERDHWYATQDLITRYVKSVLLERPRHKNQRMHREELRSLLERDYGLGANLSDNMKMQLMLLGRSNYFGSALHSDAYVNFSKIDHLMQWFCDKFRGRSVAAEAEMQVFKPLQDVIQSEELYDMFMDQQVMIQRLQLRVEFIAENGDDS